MGKTKNPGRRPKNSTDLKAEIIKAAKISFAQLGYEKSTIRHIAEIAKVDPSLIMHYYKTKEILFAESMEPPVEAQAIMNLLKVIPKETWGAAITEILLGEGKKTFPQSILGLIRAASTEEKAAQILKKTYEQQFLNSFKSINLDNFAIRSNLMSSLITGLIFTGEIVNLDGFKKASAEKKKKILAELIQNILTFKID